MPGQEPRVASPPPSDTLMRVNARYTIRLHEPTAARDLQTGVIVLGHDFGPCLRLVARSETRLIVRMQGYTFYAGRPSLVPREYQPTEYWAMDIVGREGNKLQVIVRAAIAPGNQTSLRKRWLAIWTPEAAR